MRPPQLTGLVNGTFRKISAGDEAVRHEVAAGLGVPCGCGVGLAEGEGATAAPWTPADVRAEMPPPERPPDVEPVNRRAATAGRKSRDAPTRAIAQTASTCHPRSRDLSMNPRGTGRWGSVAMLAVGRGQGKDQMVTWHGDA